MPFISSSAELERLKKTLAHFVKVTSIFQSQDDFDEKTVNAIYTLFYIDANIAVYKENETTIPQDEFNLLVDAIQKMEPYNSENSPWTRILVHHLISHLFLIHDLLIQRAL